MNVAIVTNLESRGLQTDFKMIADQFTLRGHRVCGLPHTYTPPEEEKYDLAVYIEVIPRNLIGIAPLHWAFLNPEWCKPDVVKMAHDHTDKIFAKTHEAQRVLAKQFGEKVHYVGMGARDQFDDTIPRCESFLNIGGNSAIRGTREVIDAWMWAKDGQRIANDLHIVSAVIKPPEDPRIHHYAEASDELLRYLQNHCRYHLLPSQTEGFGHAMHEALGVGAYTLVTDAPPMNEMPLAFVVPTRRKSQLYLAEIYETSAIDIYESVQRLLAGSLGSGSNHFIKGSRMFFAQMNAEFSTAFGEHIDALSGPPTVVATALRRGRHEFAFIGNFKSAESTENMIHWALEEGLGNDVVMLQEHEVNLAAITSACKNATALIWMRTPGWLTVPDPFMLKFLEQLKIPSISIHLDKFWGIPKREEQIGKIPFWKTKHVWTADGSRHDDFKARGVNHHWMVPAVSEVYCHPGRPWDMYRCDVGFVGMKDYHEEYPFRRKLVEFLEKNYAGRFRHITDLRGHGLNDFYASCKVVVGDCIFAGTPFYWSDRVPETLGRYGFLLHPEVQGLSPMIPTYKPQDLESLGNQIEACLVLDPDPWKVWRYDMAAHIRAHHTWTIRMKQILEESL